MPRLQVVQVAFKVHSCTMAIKREHTMDNFEELAGRIDGMAHALLRLTAELEMQGLIDAPRLTQAWREARPEHLATDQMLQASRLVLHQMADQLDEARNARQSQGQTR